MKSIEADASTSGSRRFRTVVFRNLLGHIAELQFWRLFFLGSLKHSPSFLGCRFRFRDSILVQDATRTIPEKTSLFHVSGPSQVRSD